MSQLREALKALADAAAFMQPVRHLVSDDDAASEYAPGTKLPGQRFADLAGAEEAARAALAAPSGEPASLLAARVEERTKLAAILDGQASHLRRPLPESVPCPYVGGRLGSWACGAGVGEPCITQWGYKREPSAMPHTARYEAAKESADA